VTFLTPAAGLVALAAGVPVAAALLGRARAEAVRRSLGLAPARRRGELARLGALAAAVALLGLAAAQPALTRGTTRRVRPDAQVLFVVDTSRSMAAASPSGPTRLARAAAAARRLRAAVPQVAAGVATLTDRVLPDLFPVADVRAFDAVTSRAVAIESPPPRETTVRATSYDALAGISDANFFAPSAKTRVVVLLTDGETVPTDTAAVGRDLRTKLIAVRFWSARESIAGESAYRPDPAGRTALLTLAAAADGELFAERDLDGAARALRAAVGTGPTVAATGNERRRTALAPFVAALALLPLAGVRLLGR
jgi:hypothetical protein